MRRRTIKGRTAQEQFETAASRIVEVIKYNLSFLDLSDLTRLRDVPDEIINAVSLVSLVLEGTKVSNIENLTKLTNLEALSVSRTKISDLSPVRNLEKLRRIYANRSLVSSLEFASNLLNLTELHLDGTSVVDLSPLSESKKLEEIWLDNTGVSDLSPLKSLKSLKALWIEGTAIDNIDSVCDSNNLIDSAYSDSDPIMHGLFYKNSKLSSLPGYADFLKYDSVSQTIEAINFARSSRDIEVYYPIGYTGPSMQADEIDEIDFDDDATEELIQRPASHSFIFNRGRIEAESQPASTNYSEIASDILGEVSSKALEASARLKSCNAPIRTISTIDRLQSSLGSSVEGLRLGVLQMRFRSLEADITAYDTVDGRKEIPEDAFALMRDLCSSVEDLMGCFPQIAEIEAERLSQRLKDADVPSVIDLLNRIRQVAEDNEVVAPSAVEALGFGDEEISHDNGIIDSMASAPARSAAIKARDRTVGYMLLVYRNFVAGSVKVAGELSGLGSDTWVRFRKKAPEHISSAVISLSISVLVNALLGPTAALSAFVLSFRPLHERARKIASKIAGKTKS